MSEGTEEILDRTEEMLQKAYAGYKLFERGDGDERMQGLWMAVVFGRSVTFVAQKLRSEYGREFDEWYAWKEKALREDPVSNYFAEMRNEILKEGKGDADSYASLSGILDPDELIPDWADAFFVGDEYGGTGFEIRHEDGETERVYLNPPEISNNRFWVESGLQFSDLETKGDAEEDLAHYIHVLAEFVDEAKKEWG